MKDSSQTLIHHFLETSAELYPDKVALIHKDVRATYAEINARANCMAHRLMQLGVENGDRVAFILRNGLEYVITYFAVLKAGAAAVPLSTGLKPDGLSLLLKSVRPKVLVTSFHFKRVLKATDLRQTNIKHLVLVSPETISQDSSFSVTAFEDLTTGGPATNPDNAIDESSLAAIIYTSGSTGEPRGVMLSHKNIVSNTHAICRYLHLTPEDIQMVVLPFFYVMGKSLLNTHFAIGGTVVINNQFAFLASVLNDMVAYKVTGFSGVPSTYAYLLHRSPLESYCEKLDHLRYCSQAGGHMSRAVKKHLRQVLPKHTKIYIMYGATEASARLTYLDPNDFHKKMDSIGKPIPGVTIRILDSRGNDVPPGQKGELVASGPNIMMGYWEDPEATSKVLDQTGYHTGDLGFMDDQGFLFVDGRKDHILKVGGHRINPQEIEDVLTDSGMLIETAVIGVPDALLGHKLIALGVIKNNGYSERQIRTYCAEKLPSYKRPSRIILCKALPKSLSGKINRTMCMEMAVKQQG